MVFVIPAFIDVFFVSFGVLFTVVKIREAIQAFFQRNGISLEQYGVANATWEIPCPVRGMCAVRETIIMKRPTRLGWLFGLNAKKTSTRIVSGGCDRKHLDCPERRKPITQDWDLS